MESLVDERFPAPRRDRYDAIYLSPHLDDAVLSCGGQIHRRAAAGEAVLVLTVFAGDPPAGEPGPLEADIVRWTKLDPASAMADRRAEDLAACDELGVEACHWRLPEAPARDRSLARLQELFRPPTGDDPAADSLHRALATLPTAGEVLAPLAAGSHRDHHVVRRAAEGAWPEGLVYYEDFPYARVAGAVAKALGEAADWQAESTALGDDDLAAKIRAIACYRSQIAPLFATGRWSFLRGRPAKQMARAVRRHAAEVDGERVWRRADGASAASIDAPGPTC